MGPYRGITIHMVMVRSRGALLERVGWWKDIRVRVGIAKMVVDLGFVWHESKQSQGLNEVERVRDDI